LAKSRQKVKFKIKKSSDFGVFQTLEARNGNLVEMEIFILFF
jgi:hypothetical protein